MADFSDTRHPWLRVPDVLAIAAIAVIVVLVTIAAITESYRNLWLFAESWGLAGFWAAIAPAVVDSFIVMGELVLFVSLVRNWDRLVRTYGWALAGSGFAVSLAGNIGHVRSAGWPARAMFALFPVAATAGLAAGLMILKRVTAGYRLKAGGQQVTGQAAPPGRKREPRQAVQREARGPAVRGRPRQIIQPTPDMLAAIRDEKLSARKLLARFPDQIPSRHAATRLVGTYAASQNGSGHETEGASDG